MPNMPVVRPCAIISPYPTTVTHSFRASWGGLCAWNGGLRLRLQSALRAGQGFTMSVLRADMSETIARMSEIYRIVFIGTVALLMLHLPIVYWKIYLVYRALGDQPRHLGFFWFSFQFQMPIFAKGMPNYLDLESFPDSLRIQISGTRHQLRIIRAIASLWLVFVLAFGAIIALLRRRYS